MIPNIEYKKKNASLLGNLLAYERILKKIFI
jgi:hypothetical protein